MAHAFLAEELDSIVKRPTETAPRHPAEIEFFGHRGIKRLRRANSYGYLNKTKLDNEWPALRVYFLTAVALVRLRRAKILDRHRFPKDTVAQARQLVRHTDPKGANAAYSESSMEKFHPPRRSIWPLACGFLYAYSRQVLRNGKLTDPLVSLHELMPKDPPISQALIDLFVAGPKIVIDAANWFADELAKESEKTRQTKPPSSPSEWVALPRLAGASMKFVPDPRIVTLTHEERQKVTKETARNGR